jgi:hypothetical protein
VLPATSASFEVTVDRLDVADGIRAWWSAMPSISRRAAPVA